MSRSLGKFATVAALASLAAAPALAAPGSTASKLSLRASTSAEKRENIAGAPIVAIIGIAAIVTGGILLIADENSPDSP